VSHEFLETCVQEYWYVGLASNCCNVLRGQKGGGCSQMATISALRPRKGKPQRTMRANCSIAPLGCKNRYVLQCSLGGDVHDPCTSGLRSWGTPINAQHALQALKSYTLQNYACCTSGTAATSGKIKLKAPWERTAPSVIDSVAVTVIVVVVVLVRLSAENDDGNNTESMM